MGVLPAVVAHDWEQPLRNWIVLVGSCNDLHTAIRFACEPHPATTELLGAGIIEFRLKIFEVAESLLEHFGDVAAGLSATFRLHNFPEHGVVYVAAAVVADRGTNVLGHGIQITQQVFGGL